ncbi:MAG: gamma-butyrobetaine hydroxylase-like domain-containing protein [Fidelibacterota bacterium]
MNSTNNPKIEQLEIVNDSLLIAWSDGTESIIALKALRDNCPCAHCAGETDVLGNIYIGPARTLKEDSYRLIRLKPVGHYALQPIWQDGHDDGLFTFDLLRKIANFGAE